MAAAGTAVGATAASFLFGYNRGNYMYDAAFRYERFTAGREFAMAQMGQYRGDIRALSALTAKKNGTYAVLSSLTMALNVALYCAGRLGLHGPSPPSWIMGLWLTNNAASFSFMALAIWLAMHANFRAESASVNLLTRYARVPVPTLRQLDKARRYASGFEQQEWSDMFRVPYLQNSGAPQTDPTTNGSATRARSAPPRKETTWVKDEFMEDRIPVGREEVEAGKAGTVTGPSTVAVPSDTLPEHFQLYGQVQKEWFAYDVYARVCMLYGWLSFFHAAAYYGLGHINIELRAFWVAYACPFVLMVLHTLLIRFDIIPGRYAQTERLPHCQWLGAVAVLPAAVGMSLDFQVQFSMTAVVGCWICIFISYICQLIYTLRLLELVLPDEWNKAFVPEERIGGSWFPDTWRVPSTFQHVLYLVAPPQRLQLGQYDIVREIKEGAGRDVVDAGMPPSSLRPASPKSAKDPTKATGPEEIWGPGGKVQYIDSLFEWAFSDEVFNNMSLQSQQRVRDLYHQFAAQARNGPANGASSDPDLLHVLQQCITGVEDIMAREGMQTLSGGESGYDSAGSEGGYGGKTPATKSAIGKTQTPFAQTAHIQPWRLVASIVVALVCGWCFMIFGTLIDVILGEQALITAPHWSRPPMTRVSLEPHEVGTPIGLPWNAGEKPWYPEQLAWHEEKRHAGSDTIFHAGGWSHRRLSEVPTVSVAHAPRGEDLAAALEGLLGALPHEVGKPEPVSWPGFFEPQMLACGPPMQGGGSAVAALTPRGFGATTHLGPLGRAPLAAAAETFKLAGISHLPPLLGVSWGVGGGDGLLLVSRAGDLVACPGSRPAAGGSWACSQPLGGPRMLPIAEGARLAAASVAWLRGPGGAGGELRLHAALVDESAPDLVALFMHDGEGEAAAWLPLGEVPVPGSQGGQATKISLAFVGGDILVTTGRGMALRKRLVDGVIVASSDGSEGHHSSWQAACGLQHGPGGVAHLHLKAAVAHSRRPELFTVELLASNAAVGQGGKAPLYQ